MRKKIKYSITVSWDFITIYINDILHIQLPSCKTMAVETWIDRSAITIWKIQFVNFETGKVILIGEYDTREKWESILKLWNSKFN